MIKWCFVLLLALTLTGCQDYKPTEPAPPVDPPEDSIESNPLNNAYFGDTHAHTIFSFDAYLFATRRTPDDAYIFGRGVR